MNHCLEQAWNQAYKLADRKALDQLLDDKIVIVNDDGSMQDKSEFLAPGEQGWQNQEILDAAYRSIKSGKAESVPRVTK